ncbi:hypothetical protein [Jiella pacifica]|uniref:Uncharacterized protein n=1 Tax=Jiella pacifica TaxID=2696469 RepID=A0A6N9T8G6_9HYPH|nr:hypothetical protein [Jiella pacifica]NDW07590.1 hypothetical protein [Jiella pacifica]
MRKQTRPFAVEIKRTKGSRQPSPFLDLPKEAGAPSRNARQDAHAFVLPPIEPAGPAPRILESTSPGWSPPAVPAAAKPKRGRPPKARAQPTADALPTTMAAPEAPLELHTNATPTKIDDAEADLPAETAADRPTFEDGVPMQPPMQPQVRRRSRRPATEGNIGSRWKRHLPRWKR